jgi:hypothetical protein
MATTDFIGEYRQLTERILAGREFSLSGVAIESALEYCSHEAIHERLQTTKRELNHVKVGLMT